jgi:hypothetical protein
MKAHWKIQKVEGLGTGWRLTLVGGNGEEVLRAMTVYNDKRDAQAAMALAQGTFSFRVVNDGDGTE